MISSVFGRGRFGRLNVTILEALREDLSWYQRVKGYSSGWTTLTDRFFWVCASYRFGHWSANNQTFFIGRVAKIAYRALNLFVSVINASDLRSGAIIGRRFTVHTAIGLLVADGVKIGDDCFVNTGVCIAHMANGRGEGVPTIGNNVKMGVGCKILGAVTIGDNASIGANAVVLRDVPANHLAVGIPAVSRPKPATSVEGSTE
jgi:serine O-acetyltransferase